MADSTDILLVEDLENDIKKLEKELYAKKNELDNIQNNCKHSIYVFYDCKPGYWVEAKCLFCGKDFETPYQLRDLHHNRIINFSNSIENMLHKERAFEKLRNRAKSILSQNSEIAEDELYEILKSNYIE